MFAFNFNFHTHIQKNGMKQTKKTIMKTSSKYFYKEHRLTYCVYFLYRKNKTEYIIRVIQNNIFLLIQESESKKTLITWNNKPVVSWNCFNILANFSV